MGLPQQPCILKRILLGSVLRKHVFFFTLLVSLLIINLTLAISPKWSVEDDARVVDIAGRQRMISQQIGFYAEQSVHHGGELHPQIYGLIEMYDASLNALKFGGVAPGYLAEIPPTKDKIVPALKEAEDEWLHYKEAVLALLKEPPSVHHDYPNLPFIEKHALILLEKNENLVKAYVKDSEKRQKFIFYSMVLSVILSISIALLGYQWGKTSILKPIRELHRVTDMMQKGNYRARAQVATGDEFECLSTAFNKALHALENLEKERTAIDHAKVMFLSVTSHELRSPMTPMKAQLQMLLSGYFGTLNKEQNHSLEVILRNTERLDLLISDLLDISMIEASKLALIFTKTNFIEEIRDIVREFRHFECDHRIKINLVMDPIPTIETDLGRVLQVFRNLLSNAIKFSKVNGTVYAEVRNLKDYILFSVRDSGVGISKEAQPRIFEAFFQEDQQFNRERQGSGLGLTLSKGIVTALGGEIWFKSTKGKGSTFYFTIPKIPPRHRQEIRKLFKS